MAKPDFNRWAPEQGRKQMHIAKGSTWSSGSPGPAPDITIHQHTFEDSHSEDGTGPGRPLNLGEVFLTKGKVFEFQGIPVPVVHGYSDGTKHDHLDK